jgi:1,2-diacylglycerol 3-beta-glucosyltransferase
MSPRLTSHLVLLLIGVVWAALVMHSLEYLGRFMFDTYLVSVRWLQILFVALSLYTGTLLLLSLRRRPHAPAAGPARPFVSLLVPARDEERVIEATLRNLARLDYHAGGRRRFELVVIDDGSSDGTPQILRRLKRELGLRVVRPPAAGRGKAAALSAGTLRARGPLLAVFDADARVAADALQRLVAALDGPRVGGAQGRRRFYNAGENLLTRMQDDEFSIIQTCLQRAREAGGAFVTFAGNGLLVRRDALQAAGGWNDLALTEDIDLSVRLYLAGYRIRYCDDAVVWEEAVASLPALLRQRTRWFEGAMRCLGELLPALLIRPMPLRVRLDMLFFLAGLLLATLALLTTYVYALIGLAGGVVLFLGIPQSVMAGISALFTVALLAAVVDERGWHPMAVGGVLLRGALFSLHRLIVVPLAIARYVGAAMTGRVDWAKTAHQGEMSTEAAGDRLT